MIIQQSSPAIEWLKDSHVASRVGFTVIEKLMYIVRDICFSSEKPSEFEQMSLKQFLKDLKITKSGKSLTIRSDKPQSINNYSYDKYLRTEPMVEGSPVVIPFDNPGFLDQLDH